MGLETEVEIYKYMVLNPLSLVDELIRGEHYHAAGVAMAKIHKDAAEFSLRLEALVEAAKPKPEAVPPAETKAPQPV